MGLCLRVWPFFYAPTRGRGSSLVLELRDGEILPAEDGAERKMSFGDCQSMLARQTRLPSPACGRGAGGEGWNLMHCVFALLLTLTASPCWGAKSEDLVQTATLLQSDFTKAIGELAAWCEEKGLKDEAQKTRAAIRPRDPYKLYVSLPPKQVGPVPVAADASADVVEWDARLGRLKRDHANAMFDLARRAVRMQRASLAYDLVLVAIRAYPDHEGIRRLMGQQNFKGQWCTAYEVRKQRAGYVWHERFGWILQSQVTRYEQGQRYQAGKWISAEEDAKNHRDIKGGWDVETEHYLIRTNHSLEAGAALGVKFERLYRVWQQLFVRFYATEAQVAAAFEGRGRPAANEQPRLQIVYFRNKDDYVRWLRPEVPNIEVSIGFYRERTGRAYFFAGQEPDDRTLYHEATHQLFHQSRPVATDVGARCNFWIVEGIAMFMESLHEENGFFVLGGLDDIRVHASQVRLLVDNFYVPLAELTTYGMIKVQNDPRIATLYSQVAGQTHFLIFYDNGRYRDALVAYLSTVYSGRDEPTTLSHFTRLSYGELDRQYHEYTEKTATEARKQEK